MSRMLISAPRSRPGAAGGGEDSPPRIPASVSTTTGVVAARSPSRTRCNRTPRTVPAAGSSGDVSVRSSQEARLAVPAGTGSWTAARRRPVQALEETSMTVPPTEPASSAAPASALFDEARSAEIVAASFAQTADPRLRQILTSLVTHLHAFVKDVALTPEEWVEGIRFLTETGQMCTDTRQEFILL